MIKRTVVGGFFVDSNEGLTDLSDKEAAVVCNTLAASLSLKSF